MTFLEGLVLLIKSNTNLEEFKQAKKDLITQGFTEEEVHKMGDLAIKYRNSN